MGGQKTIGYVLPERYCILCPYISIHMHFVKYKKKQRPDHSGALGVTSEADLLPSGRLLRYWAG